MSIKHYRQVHQVFVFSKSGKTLARKENEKEGLISFDNRKELCKFLTSFDFDCFIEHEHIVNVKIEEFLTIFQYHAFLVENEEDLNNDNFIWQENAKTTMFSAGGYEFGISVPLVIKGKQNYITKKEKGATTMLKNMTQDELIGFVSCHGDSLEVNTNFEKPFVLIIQDENGHFLRRRKKNTFFSERTLKTCLRSYGFKITIQNDINIDDKHYIYAKVISGGRVDPTYWWDEPNETERIIIEHIIKNKEEK